MEGTFWSKCNLQGAYPCFPATTRGQIPCPQAHTWGLSPPEPLTISKRQEHMLITVSQNSPDTKLSHRKPDETLHASKRMRRCRTVRHDALPAAYTPVCSTAYPAGRYGGWYQPKPMTELPRAKGAVLSIELPSSAPP